MSKLLKDMQGFYEDLEKGIINFSGARSIYQRVHNLEELLKECSQYLLDGEEPENHTHSHLSIRISAALKEE